MVVADPSNDFVKYSNTIRQRPWDELSILAFAAWLDSHDKPRARLVRVQLELSQLAYDHPRRKALQDESRDLIRENKDRWTKSLGGLIDREHVGFDIGLVDAIALTAAKDEHIAALEAVTELRVLSLSSPQLTANGFERIVRLPNLDGLMIEGESALPKESWAQLEKLPPWTVVHVYTTDEDRKTARAMNQRRVAKLKGLTPDEKHSAAVRFLGAMGDNRPMYGKPFTGANLGQSGIEDVQMEFLAYVPELEGVYISESDVTTKGIAHLAGLKELKSLNLFQTKVDSIAALAGLTKLETLGIFPEFDVKMGDAGLEGLQKFTNLKSLYLNDEAISDATVKRLAPLTKLKSLELSHAKLKSEDSLAALSGMADLRTLDLHGGDISNNALQHIAGLRKLESLNLSVSKGTGAGFKHLSGLDSLKYLFLSGDGVTDVAMEQLGSLKQLETIMAQGSAVSDNGAKKLAARLPRVTIILDKSVVKSPRETFSFRRTRLDDKVSVLLPANWSADARAETGSITTREDGWQKVGSWGGEVVGPLEIYMYSNDRAKSAKDAMMANVNNNSHLSPVILKNDVQAIEGSKDVASCIYRNDHGQHLVCAAKVNGRFIVLDCVAPVARFEEFSKLFLFVAKSIRISDDAGRHAEELIEVRAETFKSK
jgi:uncharacterized protein (TIGR02996 family)